MRNLKTLALIAAIGAALVTSAPAMALGTCHGERTADNHWDLHGDNWSRKELSEIGDLMKILDNIDPTKKHEAWDTMFAVDYRQCYGASHDEAFKDVIESTKKKAASQ